MKKFKLNKGITLVVLVVTIVVLLILAGAAISIGLNGGDLFEKANNAVTKWNAKVEEENSKINEIFGYSEEKKATFVDNLANKTHSFGDYQQITNIERATQEPAEQYKQTANIVSTEDSDCPIYMWENNNVLYWYSEIKHPKLSANSYGLFAMFKKLENTDGIRDWDTSEVTDMSSMFAECFSLTNLNLASWNTSNVTNMNSMFHTCIDLTSLNLSSWDTQGVTSMLGMFACCYNLTNLNLSSFNTSNVTNMERMFDMSEHVNFPGRLSSLQTIKVSGGFTVDGVTDSTDMFRNCTALKGGNNTPFDSTKIDKSMAHIDTSENPGYFTAAQ